MNDNRPGAHTADLVARARRGDQDGWEELVASFQPLVTSVTCRHQLSAADAADVSQTVWLRLVERLTDLREPRPLSGWLATTTARACQHLLTLTRRTVTMDARVAEGAVGGIWDQAVHWVDPADTLIRAESCPSASARLALTPRSANRRGSRQLTQG